MVIFNNLLVEKGKTLPIVPLTTPCLREIT